MAGCLNGKVALVMGPGALGDAITGRMAGEQATVLRTPPPSISSDGVLDVFVHVADPAEPDTAGLMRVMKRVVPALTRSGSGSVVLVGLPMGTEARIGITTFSTMNAALKGYARGAAVELGEAAIRVNLVTPGVLSEEPATIDPALGLIPLYREGQAGHRTGLAADIAGAALFLAGDRSSYITGTEFVVDGGLSQSRNSVGGRRYDAAAPARA